MANDDETVCLDDAQMKNIIDAARADESEDEKRIKKSCPKALKFVRGYRPKQKKEATEEVIEKAAGKVIRKAKSKAKEGLGWFGDLF